MKYIVYLLTIVLPAIKRVTDDTFMFQQDSAPANRRTKWSNCWSVKPQTSSLQICGPPTALTSIWSITSSGDHATAGLSEDVQECGWTQEATGWNLDWSGAEHYWHCYQCMQKTSACLCSHKGPTYRILTVAVEQRDIWINCQPEWPKCKPNVIYACYFNKVIILPCIKCNISLVLFSPGSVEADVGWGGKLNIHLKASCFRNICAKNRQNPLILFKVTIDNVGVPFLRHSVNLIITFLVTTNVKC